MFFAGLEFIPGSGTCRYWEVLGRRLRRKFHCIQFGICLTRAGGQDDVSPTQLPQKDKTYMADAIIESWLFENKIKHFVLDGFRMVLHGFPTIFTAVIRSNFNIRGVNSRDLFFVIARYPTMHFWRKLEEIFL